MKESTLQKKVKQAIQDRYATGVWYYHPMDRTQRGIIDVILSFYGIFVAAEIKTDLIKNPPTKLQEYNLNKIAVTGGFALKADSVEELINMLDYIKTNYILTKRNR